MHMLSFERCNGRNCLGKHSNHEQNDAYSSSRRKSASRAQIPRFQADVRKLATTGSRLHSLRTLVRRQNRKKTHSFEIFIPGFPILDWPLQNSTHRRANGCAPPTSAGGAERMERIVVLFPRRHKQGGELSVITSILYVFLSRFILLAMGHRKARAGISRWVTAVRLIRQRLWRRRAWEQAVARFP